MIVALIAYDRIVGDEPIPAISDSRSAAVFANMQEDIEARIPTDMPSWIQDRYEALVGGEEEAAAPTEEATE